MPQTIEHRVTLRYPTMAEYLVRYPHMVWDTVHMPFLPVLQDPANIHAMIVATQLGRTAIEAVAQRLADHFASLPVRQRPDWDRIKQLAGAYVACVMELNGYARTGRKQAVPVDHWNRAEVYEPVGDDA